MTWLDRILGREPKVEYHLSVNNSVVAAEQPKPHNYCSKCGQPMVEGYLVYGHSFDRVSGQPTLKVLRRRLCLTLHKQELEPTDDEHPSKQADHDGYPVNSIGWGFSIGMGLDPYEYIPDCEPRKKAAA